MAITRQEINANERVNFTGDVHVTGNIGNGAVVTVQDGSLTVDGSVAENATIQLTQKPQFVGGNSFFIYSSAQSNHVWIKGSVGTNTRINAKNAEITIDGDVDDNCHLKTYNGGVSARNAGKRTELKTYNGSVGADDVQEDSVLRTYNGTVRARSLAPNCKACTYNGNVKITQSAPDTAALETYNGDVYVAGVKRPRPERSGANSIIVTGGNRVFVNGREITAEANRPRYDAYAGAKTGAATGFILFCGTAVTLAIVFAIPVLPFLLAAAGAAFAGIVIGGLIGHAIQRCLSSPSPAGAGAPAQQANEYAGGTKTLQRKMGGSTFTFENSADTTIVQQAPRRDDVVTEVPVEAYRGDEQRLGMK